MSNVRKKKLLSKRHIRRIIADQTNIDIAGCSKQSSKEVHIIHTCIEDTCDSDVPEIVNKKNHMFDINSTIVDIDNKILFSNNECAKHYEQCETSVQRGDDRNLNNVTTNNTERNNKKEFQNAIATWVVSYEVPHNACNALLKILQKYTPYNYPSQMRTLLQTPRQTDLSKVCEGEYFHWSLDNIIQKMLLKCDENESIDLLINIDGLPLGKSSNASLWLILCLNTKNNAVYLIGSYFGYEKLRDPNVFLQSLVNDLTRLINQGFHKNSKIIKITLFGLICDAPEKRSLCA